MAERGRPLVFQLTSLYGEFANYRIIKVPPQRATRSQEQRYAGDTCYGMLLLKLGFRRFPGGISFISHP
jgi:hypothetical protein